MLEGFEAGGSETLAETTIVVEQTTVYDVTTLAYEPDSYSTTVPLGLLGVLGFAVGFYFAVKLFKWGKCKNFNVYC